MRYVKCFFAVEQYHINYVQKIFNLGFGLSVCAFMLELIRARLAEWSQKPIDSNWMESADMTSLRIHIYLKHCKHFVH